MHFFHEVGLDYVSCSPFRVPVARLEAGRAAVTEIDLRHPLDGLQVGTSDVELVLDAAQLVPGHREVGPGR